MFYRGRSFRSHVPAQFLLEVARRKMHFYCTLAARFSATACGDRGSDTKHVFVTGSKKTVRRQPFRFLKKDHLPTEALVLAVTHYAAPNPGP